MNNAGSTRADVIERIVEWRTPLYDERCPMILAWSQKAGCTTAVSWFFWHAGQLEKAKNYHPWIHEYENQVFTRRKNYRRDLREALDRGELPIVKYVRDPYVRTVSSFLSLSGSAVNEKSGHFTHKLWRSVREWVHGNPETSEGISFREFLAWLEEKGVEPAQVDGHVAAQCFEGEELLNIRYVQLEQIQQLAPILETRLGLAESPIEELNAKAHHRGTGGRSERSEAGPDKRISERTYYRQPTPAVTDFYDEDTESRVEKVFARDIEAYRAAMGSEEWGVK